MCCKACWANSYNFKEDFGWLLQWLAVQTYHPGAAWTWGRTYRCCHGHLDFCWPYKMGPLLVVNGVTTFNPYEWFLDKWLTGVFDPYKWSYNPAVFAGDGVHFVEGWVHIRDLLRPWMPDTPDTLPKISMMFLVGVPRLKDYDWKSGKHIGVLIISLIH